MAAYEQPVDTGSRQPDQGLPEHNIAERLRVVAATYPAQIALGEGARKLRFDELDRLTNQIAHALLDILGEGEEPVAMLFEQGIDMLTALLGVIKAGKAYLPLDENLPTDQLREIMEAATPRVLLTHQPFLQKSSQLIQHVLDRVQIVNLNSLDRDLPEDVPPVTIRPDTIAVVLFTSGSTGKPRAVQRSHETILSNVLRSSPVARMGPGDKMALTMHYTFGWSRSVIFSTLLLGATVVPYDLRQHGLGAFAPWLREAEVTRIQLLSSLMRQWMQVIDDPLDLPHLRVVVTGGDVLTGEDVLRFRQLFPPTCVLTTGLGLSELGVVTIYVIDHDTPVEDQLMPVGYPVQGREILIVDEDRKEVPVGEIGEIVIRSVALGAGYMGDAEASRAKFVSDPHHPGKILFYTGDLGRLRPDGCLILVGRKDLQVKIRGSKVILPDVEVQLKALPGVADAAAMAREVVPGQVRLVGYLQRDPGSLTLSDSALREHLVGMLSDHMIPSQFLWLERIPRLPSGKIDRRSLPPPEPVRPELAYDYEPPGDEIEAELVAIWEKLLAVRPVGIDDKFFDLGGHSLLASAVVAEIEKRFGQTVSMARLAQAPTIRLLAAMLREPGRDERLPTLITIQSEGTRDPLFCMHPRGGLVGLYHHLARHLGPDQPVYGLQALGLDGLTTPHRTIEQMAEYYIDEIKEVQPQGPYNLCGFSLGGLIAHEMACQLQLSGDTVGMLAFLDTYTPLTTLGRIRDGIVVFGSHITDELGKAVHASGKTLRALGQRSPVKWASYLRQRGQAIQAERARQTANRIATSDPFNQPEWTPERRVLWANRRASETHQRKIYGGSAIFIQSSEQKKGHRKVDEYWGPFVTGGIEIILLPGTHRGMLEEPGVRMLATHLNEALARTG